MGSALSSKRANIYPRPEAVTEYGKIQGKHYVLEDGRVTDIYLGVPFAKPPIGDLRFQVGGFKTAEDRLFLSKNGMNCIETSSWYKNKQKK